MRPRMLLRYGIEKAAGTQKEAARLINYSSEMLSRILSGERNIAPDVAPKLAGMHMMAGLALAQEVTGYNVFSYIEGDRHLQTMIQRSMKEDAEADAAIKELPWRIIDKNKPEDLTEDDKNVIKITAREISHRIKHDLNLLIELEDHYKLGLLDELLQKEKATQKAG